MGRRTVVIFRSAGGRLSTARLLLRPNPPASARARVLVLGALALVMGVYSAAWLSRGLWPVLPFAGLELAVVAAALHLTARRARCFDAVAVDARELRVRRQRLTGRSTETWQSGWARVRLAPGRHPWYPVRLLVGAHGRWTELGRFLTEAERREAGECLRRALDPHAVRQRKV